MGRAKGKVSGVANALWIALWASAASASQDEGWTDSFQSREGIFAFRADLKQHRVLLFRADDRGAEGRREYRLRLAGAGGASLLVNLRRVGEAGPPWKFGAEMKAWDEIPDFAELEKSEDGRTWTKVGRFLRPKE